MRKLLPALLLLAGACEGSATIDAGADASGDAGPALPDHLGPDDRPAPLFVPGAHDGATELPLVVLLHGYSVDAMAEDLYLGMSRNARRLGFYLLLPDGTIDADGEPHWDVLGAVVDDHAYLRALIEEAEAALPIGDVFVAGHSNGGFMAYRLACDSADLVSGIASLAGSDAIASCAPSQPVAVLQIHGTADGTVAYGGGSIAGYEFPSAPLTVERWAERAGCDTTATETLSPLDLVANLDGAETEVLAYATGCATGVELWSMQGADHIPAFTSDFTPAVIAWLRAHGR
jgi:polyhydroxybutyrate depolymerase